MAGDEAGSAIRVGKLKLIKHCFPEILQLCELKTDLLKKQTHRASPRVSHRVWGKLKISLVKILTGFDSMETRKNGRDQTVTVPLSSAKEEPCNTVTPDSLRKLPTRENSHS